MADNMEMTVYEVSQINAYLKDKLDSDAFLNNICIRGEVSNYRSSPAGHCYFTLKDAHGALRCVMFRGSSLRLRFRPENGMKVLAVGKITVYERDGVYQLNCAGMTPDGVGDLHVAYEQLKEKLLAEGLFDQAHKKPLPAFPHRIAVVTSSTGAAVHDILRILGKRYPLSRVVLLPVRVQGAEAPPEIAGAIRYASRHAVADVILTGRGGGSIEDLWAFNDERVARAIYNCKIPVVSAVGHEPDVTIADWVADVRAATPSNGAEIIAPDQFELRKRLRNQQARMTAVLERQLKLARARLTDLAGRRVLQSPINYIEDRRLLLDQITRRLLTAERQRLERARAGLSRLSAALDAMSPLKVLDRGYSMAFAGERIVKSVHDVAVGEAVALRLPDGTVRASVTEIKEDTSDAGTVG